MNFFKAVFADDSELSDEENHPSVSESSQRLPDYDEEHQQEEEEYDGEAPLDEHDPESESESDPNPNLNPSPKSSGGSGWSFGGLIKNLSTKSESVLQTYRRDFEEFRSGLKKETDVIREVASRAVKGLPGSLEVGVTVAQESLESVGQAVDDFGSSVWRGTAEIISHGKEAFLAADSESDSSDTQQLIRNPTLSSKRYSRFEVQVQAVQTDVNTYCGEPEDLDDFNKWKSGFVLEEKAEEIETLCRENGVMEGIYVTLVPSAVDHEIFWSRYFYRIYKLKQVEDARANLVKRVISKEEEEDLSWDVDDDDDETIGSADAKVSTSEEKQLEKEGSSEIASGKKTVEEEPVSSPKVAAATMGQVAESVSDNGSDESVLNGDQSVTKSGENALLEGKTDSGESSKDSDFSVVSSHPSLPEEEEDLGWDEIEDLGSSDEKKESNGGSPNRADLRKRLSAADEEEDLSWDIEDDD
ncbi:BSD domain-containing protein 1-like [Macadamia integrifolia]|uniref:BSD domain-containing protein 1-like n=1 Tax=Macadamia integrifolia TaxID=60698 RepID=UPI001C52E196|nr:BSD domain-containing protein 1-like [Macadamia integrifolia]XP_042476506.1 BSD domain-containing protein 1-like [Macadamia integrifolia]